MSTSSRLALVVSLCLASGLLAACQPTAQSTAEQNVATVRRFYDEYAAGNADIILEVHLDTIKMHYAGEVEDVPTQVLRDDLSTNLLIYQSTNHHQE